MTISTDTLVDFFGTQTALQSSDSSGASVGSSAFLIAGSTFTNSDNAPEGTCVLKATWATAPSAGGAVLLYSRMLGIGAASTDMTAPSTINKQFLVGTFPAVASTAVQVLPAIIGMPNMEADQAYEFYVENQTSQTMSSGWTLHLTPRTQGPSTG